MADKIPVKFLYDDTTPSALGEFTSQDTVSVSNGGTSVSSLADLGTSLSGTNISAISVSSTTFTGGSFTGSSVSATNVSAITVSAISVYASSFASPGDVNSLLLRRDLGATYPNLLQAREGALTLMAENVIALRSQTGELYARFSSNGANELYYDNSKKLETTNTGVTITGLLGGASSVSATNVSAINVSAISLSGTGVSAVSVSATHLSAVSVSATSVSAVAIGTIASSMTVSNCPVPQPFAYVKLDDDGTAASTETNVGAGATLTDVTSNNSHDINWTGSTKNYFTILHRGTYELVARLSLEVASSTKVTIKIKNNTTVVNTIDTFINSALDPHEATISAVFAAIPTEEISVTHTDDGSANVNAAAGTTLTIKRLM